mgnify:CR=1 FL=1|jgi:hypothetical protein|nr:MAG TPA: hypothetical protein [Caudoviricetes sp.]
MREKEINICPFRVTTVTYPPILKGTGDVTKAYFEPCLKKECPAFYILHGIHGQEYERCKRLNCIEKYENRTN